ncbi:hypothetical protein, partial [Serratia marcescens]|uniref:hypothetical protein n=1 Tax=Serratia marcescens TaxID=615 RepID=UPI001CA35F6B
LILGHHLEYTHTPKGLPLNCRCDRSGSIKAYFPLKSCEKSQFFAGFILLIKSNACFLLRIMFPFPLIYINLPQRVNPKVAATNSII